MGPVQCHDITLVLCLRLPALKIPPAGGEAKVGELPRPAGGPIHILFIARRFLAIFPSGSMAPGLAGDVFAKLLYLPNRSGGGCFVCWPKPTQRYFLFALAAKCSALAAQTSEILIGTKRAALGRREVGGRRMSAGPIATGRRTAGLLLLELGEGGGAR